MFAWLLNLVYLGLLVALSPWLVFQAVVRGKYRRGWREKILGLLPPRIGAGRCLWFHAVSVGEVLQLQPLIETLRQARPDLQITISATTATGYDLARQKYPDVQIVWYPLDFSWAVARALERVRPDLVVLVELELWPNFLAAAAERRIPVLLINARISERSFRGYRRIRPIVLAMLSRLRRLAVQSEIYAERLIALGAERSRIHLTGSIKFDRVETNRQSPKTEALGRLLGIGAGDRVFIAGSTQDPEERYAIEAWLAARKRFPEVRLILVPRHKERFEEVARIVERDYKLPLIRRSRLTGGGGDAPSSRDAVLLLDTLGELSACWGLADIAFVGGSLTQRGGQNMIEPAGYGAAVLFGPNTWNFKDVVDLLRGRDAALVVTSAEDLRSRLEDLLANPETARAMGARAQSLVAAQRGATERTAELILTALDDSPRHEPHLISRAA